MGRGKKKNVTNTEKLYIVLQPYIRKKEIRDVLQCSIKRAEAVFSDIILKMKQKNLRIIDYSVVPTKLFLEYCNLTLDDFYKRAELEKQIKE